MGASSGDTLYRADGTPVELERELGSGGQGTVYATDRPNLCAKIYTSGDSESEAKLETMVANPPTDHTFEDDGTRSIAWPQDLLYKGKSRDKFVGFLMPEISTAEYVRLEPFMDDVDNWRTRLVAAYNLASVVGSVHSQGHRIGDLNDENVLVSRDTGFVAVIDCDSFHVRDPSGREFPSKVHRPEYSAPEMLDASASGYDREATDLFILGFMVFQLLMDGAKPYQAIGPTGSTADKIRKGAYPYENPQPGRLEPPLYAPPYRVQPPEIRRLFEQTFVQGHGSPSRRPSAKRWRRTLQDALEDVTQCAVEPDHHYGGHLGPRDCPWCGDVKSQSSQGQQKAGSTTQQTTNPTAGTTNAQNQQQTARTPPQPPQAGNPANPKPNPSPKTTYTGQGTQTSSTPAGVVYLLEKLPSFSSVGSRVRGAVSLPAPAMALIAFLGLAGLVGAPLMLDRGPPAIAHASVAFPSVLVLPGLFAASGLAVSRGAGAIAAAAAIPFALFFPAPQLVEELLLVSLGAGLLLVLVGMQTSRDLVLYGVATAAFGAVPVGAFWLYGIAVAQVPALVASASWGLFLAVHTAGAANIVYPQWWSGAGRTTRLLAVTGMLLFTVSILAAGLLGGLQLVESFPSVWPAP